MQFVNCHLKFNNLRALLIICGLFLSINISIGQPPPQGAKVHYPDLDRFSGTWKCYADSFEFEMTLKKVFYHFKSGKYDEDIILGWHKYIKRNVTIEDYTMSSNVDSTHTIFLYKSVFLKKDSDTIIGSIVDKSRSKKLDLKLFFIASNFDTLSCIIVSPGDIIVPPMKSGMTFPSKMIFKRVSPGGS